MEHGTVISELAKFIQKVMVRAGVGVLVITPQTIVQTPTEAEEDKHE
jgi:hypothetical protein